MGDFVWELCTGDLFEKASSSIVCQDPLGKLRLTDANLEYPCQSLESDRNGYLPRFPRSVNSRDRQVQ